MADRVQHRRDTAARWAEVNPVLLEGEIGYVLDNPNQHKIGDGEHAWNDLPLRGFTGNIAQSFGDDENAVVSQKVVTEVRDALEAAVESNTEKFSEIDGKFVEQDGMNVMLVNAISDEAERAQEAEQALGTDLTHLKLFIDGNTEANEVNFDAYETAVISPLQATTTVSGGKIVYVRNPNTDNLIANGFFYKVDGKYYRDANIGGTDVLIAYRAVDRTLYKNKKYICNGITYVADGDFLVKPLSNIINENIGNISERVDSLSDDIEAEVTRATTAEEALSNAVEQEAGRATDAEISLANQLGEEEARAKAAEAALSQEIKDTVAAVIDGAPETLDTLKEVAAWIEKDESGAAAMAERIAENTGRIETLETASATKEELSAEAERAQSAEQANAAAIAAEVERAGAKEQEIEGTVAELESKVVSNILLLEKGTLDGNTGNILPSNTRVVSNRIIKNFSVKTTEGFLVYEVYTYDIETHNVIKKDVMSKDTYSSSFDTSAEYVKVSFRKTENEEFDSVEGIIGYFAYTDIENLRNEIKNIESNLSNIDLNGRGNVLVSKDLSIIKGGNTYEINLSKTPWDISEITLSEGSFMIFTIVGVSLNGSSLALVKNAYNEFPSDKRFNINVPNDIVKVYVEFRASKGESVKMEIKSEPFVNTIKSKQPIAEMSLWNADIYTSKTSNLLDVNHVLYGWYAVENETSRIIEFKKDETYNAAVSRLIPLSNVNSGKITISGVPSNSYTKIVFLKDVDFHSAFTLYNINVAERTISIPNGSVYAVVVLRGINQSDFSNIKLSNNDSATYEDFEPQYIGNIHYATFMKEDDLDCLSKSSNVLDITAFDTDLRITDTAPYFVEGNEQVPISKPIFVKGQKYITIKSVSAQKYTRWLAWTKDTLRTEQSVISVVAGLPPTADNNEIVRTLEVPEDAVYMYYTLSTLGAMDEDWKGTTIAYGEIPTDEEYIGGGDIYRYKDKFFYNQPRQTEVDLVYVTERERMYRNVIPYSVGTPSENLSFDNQYERCNLLFFTDSHIDFVNTKESLENVKQAVMFASKGKLPISALIHTGDIITPYGIRTKADVKGVAKPFFDALKQTSIPSVFAIGNHDNNDWNNTPNNIFRADDWGEMWLNYAEENYGIVRQTKADGTKSTWHYLDLPKWKIRIISVDAQDIDHDTTNADGNALYYGGNSWYVSNEQMLWLANTALNITEDGWGVVVCLHQTYSSGNAWYATSVNPSYEGSIKKMMDMLAAFAKHETYNQNAYTNSNPFYNLDAISKDFSFEGLTDKPRLICVLNGHEHFDRVDNYNGVNVIWTSNNSATTVSSDSRVARILGTSTQNLFDIINIDTRMHKLRVFRFGANMNCYGEGGDRFVPDGLDY